MTEAPDHPFLSPDGRWAWNAARNEWSPYYGAAADRSLPSATASPDGEWVWNSHTGSWAPRDRHPGGLPGQHPGSEPESLTGRPRRKGPVLIVAALLAAIGVAVGILAFSGGADESTFSGGGKIEIDGPSYRAPYSGLPPVDGYTTDGKTCFANGAKATTLSPRTGSIVLGVIGKSDVDGTLYDGKPIGGKCVIRFEFTGIPHTDADDDYLIRIPGNTAVATTEQELRKGVLLTEESATSAYSTDSPSGNSPPPAGPSDTTAAADPTQSPASPSQTFPAASENGRAQTACLTWQSIEKQGLSQAEAGPVQEMAASQAGASGSRWQNLAKAMRALARTPNNGLTPTQLRLATASLDTIKGGCNKLGVKIKF